MNLKDIDLDRDLNFREKAFIRSAYHERVKEWISDAYVYPITLCVAFWCMMAVLEKIV